MCTGRCSEGNMEDMPRAQDCCCCSSLFAPLRSRASSWTLPTEGILQLEWLCHFLCHFTTQDLWKEPLLVLFRAIVSAPHFVLGKKGEENELRTGSVLGTSLSVSGAPTASGGARPSLCLALWNPPPLMPWPCLLPLNCLGKPPAAWALLPETPLPQRAGPSAGTAPAVWLPKPEEKKAWVSPPGTATVHQISSSSKKDAL